MLAVACFSDILNDFVARCQRWKNGPKGLLASRATPSFQNPHFAEFVVWLDLPPGWERLLCRVRALAGPAGRLAGSGQARFWDEFMVLFFMILA